MMRWVSDVMWFICRALAWVLQLAGVAGLLLAAMVGLWALAGRINEM